MDAEINRIIDKTHFKTFERFKHHVQKIHPNVADKQLQEIYKRRIKDPFV